MNASPPNPAPNPSPNPQPPIDPTTAQVLQLRNWIKLRDEMAELHARLEYLKLMLNLRIAR